MKINHFNISLFSIKFIIWCWYLKRPIIKQHVWHLQYMISQYFKDNSFSKLKKPLLTIYGCFEARHWYVSIHTWGYRAFWVMHGVMFSKMIQLVFVYAEYLYLWVNVFVRALTLVIKHVVQYRIPVFQPSTTKTLINNVKRYIF